LNHGKRHESSVSRFGLETTEETKKAIDLLGFRFVADARRLETDSLFCLVERGHEVHVQYNLNK
jgi:hypothetical protein